jgi:UDP-N-acetylglucosamine 4,6-dehydratase (inverting)
MYKDKSILVTGGTGSFGKQFVETILKNHKEVRKLIVYSRDELKQFEMAQVYSPKKYPCIRYFIGDVRDQYRLSRACEDVDIIVHAAALKQVPTAEYNPMEYIMTNIIGAENVINAALDNHITDVVALSTDKAAAPINLYGATKLCSDKLFVAANNIKGRRELRFSVVRYGNVMGSRGSVIPFFMEQKKSGVLPITNTDMTRFNITLQDGVNMVLWALENHWGSELFVPKIPSYRILDIANAIGPECKHKTIGIRPGEKIHEELITEADSFTTYDIGKYYSILPMDTAWSLDEYIDTFKAKKVESGFKYNSGTNDQWLSIDQIRKLIIDFVYPDFKV